MDADDFQDLYKLLRGSRSAIAVLDARALYLENKMVESFEKLVYARETFVESRSRLIKQDVKQQVDSKAKDADLQIKKLKRKQDKILDTVKAFDELLPLMEKLAEREKATKAKEAADHLAVVELPEHAELEVEQEPLGGRQPTADSVVARSADVSQAFVESFQDVEGDELLDLISHQFGFREVQSDQDILGDALYYIQTNKGNFLVVTPATEEMTDTITLTSAIDAKPIKPFPRKAFLQLGRRRRMVLLTKREERLDNVQANDIEMDTELGDKPPEHEVQEVRKGEPKVLDSGAFGQLLSAAQRCQLVSGADQIGHVRDREFRMGKYEHAFQAIDSIFARFSANVNQRTQQLSHEDAEIAAGRIKISPKDLQAKRTRDRMQTQEIDRANRRFQVVLEGLRILMNTT